MSQALKVLFFGNPLWDYMATVPEKAVTDLGLALNGATLADDDKFVDHLTTIASANGQQMENAAGGSAQNSARATAWVWEQLFGSQAPFEQVSFTGCVANDQKATDMQQACTDAGVTAQYQVLPDVADGKKCGTGTCAVFINGKNRSLVASLQAAAKFDDAKLNESEMDKFDMFYIEGFLASSAEKAIRKMAGFSKSKSNKKLLVNLSAPFIATGFKNLWLEIYDSIDYLFANESEIAAFAEAIDLKYSSLAELAVKLANRQAGRTMTVVITQGAEDTIIAQTGDKAATMHPIAKVASEKIVDTNGAGDSYVGGFVAGLMKGLSVAECARLGAVAAKHVIQRVGAKYEVASEEEKAAMKNAARFAIDNLREQLVEKTATINDIEDEVEELKKHRTVMVGLFLGVGGLGLLCLAVLGVKQTRLRKQAAKLHEYPQSTAVTAV